MAPTCGSEGQTAVKSGSEETIPSRRAQVSGGIRTVLISASAITLPDADETALDALAKVRSRRSAG